MPNFKRLRPARLSEGLKRRARENTVIRPFLVDLAVGRDFHYDDVASSREEIIDILNLLVPHKVEGFEKCRVGAHTEGGYVMLEDFDGLTAAYSLGINDDVSWDKDFIARCPIPVFQYDHTIDGLPEEHPLFNWRKQGIADSDDLSRSMRSIPSLLRENRHENESGLLLKCDIENSEWSVFSNIEPSTLSCFKQILLEMHNLHLLADRSFRNTAGKAIGELTKNHSVIHVHANNFSPYGIVSGIPIPNVLELSLVRRDADKVFIPSNETFPTSLDRPNNGTRADFSLGTFRFS